jgi:hypothetical protein
MLHVVHAMRKKNTRNNEHNMILSAPSQRNRAGSQVPARPNIIMVSPEPRHSVESFHSPDEYFGGGSIEETKSWQQSSISDTWHRQQDIQPDFGVNRAVPDIIISDTESAGPPIIPKKVSTRHVPAIRHNIVDAVEDLTASDRLDRRKKLL